MQNADPSSPIRSPHHNSIRGILRVCGPLAVGLGAILILIGLGSFFSSFASFGGPPRYFWCAFLGMPLIFIGTVMCKFGYLGDVARYVAGETAPVAKDTFNYMANETQPGVRTIAKSITEGVVEGTKVRQDE